MLPRIGIAAIFAPALPGSLPGWGARRQIPKGCSSLRRPAHDRPHLRPYRCGPPTRHRPANRSRGGMEPGAPACGFSGPAFFHHHSQSDLHTGRRGPVTATTTMGSAWSSPQLTRAGEPDAILPKVAADRKPDERSADILVRLTLDPVRPVSVAGAKAPGGRFNTL
jgi:hypothetical protein